MGQITPNIGIYVPAAGETNYDASFLAGMINIDQHDHSGPPNGGVPISGAGLAAGAVTFDKLNANVADNTTGIGTNGIDGANQLSLLGLVKSLYTLGQVAGTGFISRNNTLSNSRTITGTANQIAVSNGDGAAGNPVISLPANVTNSNQSSFLANSAVQSNVTGDGTNFVVPFTSVAVGPTIPPLFNRGGNWNGASTYTAPVTGVYMVHSDLSLTGITTGAGGNTDAEIRIRINSNNVYSNFNGNIAGVVNSGGGFVIDVNQIMFLNAGDTVRIQLNINGSATPNVGIADGTFSAVLLS